MIDHEHERDGEEIGSVAIHESTEPPGPFTARCQGCPWTFTHPDMQTCELAGRNHLKDEHP